MFGFDQEPEVAATTWPSSFFLDAGGITGWLAPESGHRSDATRRAPGAALAQQTTRS